MQSPDVVFDTATALLAAVVAGYAELSVELPTEQGVSFAEPVWDCEQLLVYGQDVGQGQPGASVDTQVLNAGVEITRFATMWIEVVRCVHHLQDDGDNPIFPTVAEKTADAAIILRDLFMLPYVIFKRRKVLELPAGCQLVGIGRCNAISAQGEFAASRLIVEVGV